MKEAMVVFFVLFFDVFMSRVLGDLVVVLKARRRGLRWMRRWFFSFFFGNVCAQWKQRVGSRDGDVAFLCP